MRRSTHHLGFAHLATTNMGKLIPLSCIDVLPGDSFRVQTSLMLRVSPLVWPVMHPVEIRVHHWYVPNRLLWSDFEQWCVGDDTKIKPTLALNGSSGSLGDHFGMEPVAGAVVDALPFYAYNTIYNEFYRDQDLTAARSLEHQTPAQVSWEKDYFTVARPSTQVGPGADIPITGKGYMSHVWRGGINNPDNETQVQDVNSGPAEPVAGKNLRTLYSSTTEPYPFVNLAQGSIDIDEFRRAMALQRFAEARARYGDRYVDYLRFLGINPSDGRLGRPEYVGGGKSMISFSEVLATAQGSSTQVGDMFGHGIAGLRVKPVRKFFEEHGWFMTLLSIRPRSMYMQGIPRRFQRMMPMDVWQKELEVLPWQEVRQTEVWGAGSKDVTFGYSARYDEYRHNFSYVSGDFRTTLKDWHMGRDFTAAPTLNSTFIGCNPTNRIFQQTSTTAQILISSSHDISARRLVSREATL